MAVWGGSAFDHQPGHALVEHEVAESFVVRVAPDIELLPERMWRAPAQPEYGRAIVIAAVPSLHLTPGELLDVRLAKN